LNGLRGTSNGQCRDRLITVGARVLRVSADTFMTPGARSNVAAQPQHLHETKIVF
jgi:hypothetical protein